MYERIAYLYCMRGQICECRLFVIICRLWAPDSLFRSIIIGKKVVNNNHNGVETVLITALMMLFNDYRQFKHVEQSQVSIELANTMRQTYLSPLYRNLLSNAQARHARFNMYKKWNHDYGYYGFVPFVLFSSTFYQRRDVVSDCSFYILRSIQFNNLSIQIVRLTK